MRLVKSARRGAGLLVSLLFCQYISLSSAFISRQPATLGWGRQCDALVVRRAADVQESAPTTVLDGKAREKRIAELVEEIRRNAGTPKVIEPLRDAVKLTGTGEIRKEFFKAIFPFELDDFQLSALDALGFRENTIVSAPTGSGKTVAGELAIYYAIAMGLKVFYTTPLKALSNQKFVDFGNQFGAERVGLLTGDTNINRGAQVTIMTTEVYRNMLYQGDTGELDDLFAVVFDEFHYMNDPERGTVWEESVILSPPHVLFVALSATIANVGQVAGWMTSVHGPTRMVVSDFRPVPLRYYFADSEGMYKLFEHEEAGPGAKLGLHKAVRPKGMTPAVLPANKGKKGAKKGRLTGSDAMAMMAAQDDGPDPEVTTPGFGTQPPVVEVLQPINDLLKKRALRERRLLLENTVGYRGAGRLSRPPDGARFTAGYRDVVEALKRRDLLPAIVFLFSRNGCDRAGAEIGGVATKLGLLTPQEKQTVKDRIQAWRASNPAVPLEKERARLLLQGIASHHAGLLPVYKTLVEELFNANLVKVVFATETLAAGVNMPARCTVITSISKKIGKTVIKLAPSQLLQMAGRAGRRGKDQQGHVVLMRSRHEDALDGYDLITSPVDSIASHFRSSYAMVVNMLRTRDLDSCRLLVDRSFGNYLKVFGLGEGLREDEERLEALQQRLQGVDLGELKLAHKLGERLDKAQRGLRDMRRETDKIENRFVSAVLGPARMGAGLLLRDGCSGALVGETMVQNPLMGKGGKRGGGMMTLTVVLTDQGEVQAIEAQAVRNVDVDATMGLDVETAFQIGALVTGGQQGLAWRPLGGDLGGFRAVATDPTSDEAKGLFTYLQEVGGRIKPVGTLPQPEELTRQENLVAQLKQQLDDCPGGRDAGELMSQVQQLEKLERRTRRKRKQLEGAALKEWNDFNAAVEVLSTYGALDVESKPSPLGLLVGDVRSENELWAAMVLLSDGLADLEGVDLVGVLSALVNDISKPDIRMRFTASQPAQEHMSRLFPAREELLKSQAERGLDFPCPFETSLAGLAQCWYAGFTWRELVDTTSLDQGDVCRHLRRVIDLLRQIPVLPKGLVPERLKNTARDAADRMDRFPVADDLIVRTGGERDDSPILPEDDDDEEIEVDQYELVEDESVLDILDEDEEEGSLLSELYKISRRPSQAQRPVGVTPVFRKKVVKMTKGELRRGRDKDRQDAMAAAAQATTSTLDEEEEEEDEEEELKPEGPRYGVVTAEEEDDDELSKVEGFLAALEGWAADGSGGESSDEDGGGDSEEEQADQDDPEYA